MPINPEIWNTLRNLREDQFKIPSFMDETILMALDSFISIVGENPKILSDFRNDDPRQHGLGLAVDTVFVQSDPLFIWENALASGLFSGIGIYLNEKNIVSFHFDTRVDRTPADPATWGDFISYPIDPDTNMPFRKDNYTEALAVIDEIKKKMPAIMSALLIIAIFWLMMRK